MTTKKQKAMSIINMCNTIERDKKDCDFWLSKIKEICEELINGK